MLEDPYSFFQILERTQIIHNYHYDGSVFYKCEGDSYVAISEKEVFVELKLIVKGLGDDITSKLSSYVTNPQI